jgi:hypothetical protein
VRQNQQSDNPYIEHKIPPFLIGDALTLDSFRHPEIRR